MRWILGRSTIPMRKRLAGRPNESCGGSSPRIALQVSRTRSLERQLASCHLVEHGTEGEQVCAGIQVFGLHLIRRHVTDRSQHRSGAGQVPGIRIGDCFSIATGRGDLASHFRQTEVEYLGVAAPRYENISRFDVAMHDAFAARRVESVRDVNRAMKSQRAVVSSPLDPGY
jgi:hypothetical protein